MNEIIFTIGILNLSKTNIFSVGSEIESHAFKF